MNARQFIGYKSVKPNLLQESIPAHKMLLEIIMMPLSRHSARNRPAHKKSCLRRGFTVVEVMAGVSIIALVAGVVIFGLSQLNYYASVNRLFTAAQTLAQNQIDLILTKVPFNPG